MLWQVNGHPVLEDVVYRGPSKKFKVVICPEQQFAVWHAEAPAHFNWQETGRIGSERECWDYVENHEAILGYIFRFSDQ